jgi:hypothetical protein
MPAHINDALENDILQIEQNIQFNANQTSPILIFSVDDSENKLDRYIELQAEKLYNVIFEPNEEIDKTSIEFISIIKKIKINLSIRSKYKSKWYFSTEELGKKIYNLSYEFFHSAGIKKNDIASGLQLLFEIIKL